MKTDNWFSQLSKKQLIYLFATILAMVAIVIAGWFATPKEKSHKDLNFSTKMSIRQIAPKLGITGKSLARELDLPLNAPKKKPLKNLGISEEKLQQAVEHIASHQDTRIKYYVYGALFLWGFIFLVRIGRPEKSNNKKHWYPRWPYIASLLISVVIAGFLFGKSPNPMEGIVKVFKSMVGLYPNPLTKVIAFVFFILLAVIGNKIICGWACPFGALQELIYSLPILSKIKRKKLPFVVTNTIRTIIFISMLFFLFGIIGGRKGTVIYHYVNPFNLFNLDFESLSIILTITIALLGSIFTYRPFCMFICPFGFVSWLAERLSIYRVRIDKEKCTQCGACYRKCPLEAIQGRVSGKKMPADCFSCGRCLNVCPVDAIQYKWREEKKTKD